MSLTEGNNETPVGEAFLGLNHSVVYGLKLKLCIFGKAYLDLDPC